MNKNTIEEKELLESLFVIEQLLEDVRNNVHRDITQEDRTNVDRVLEKARVAYPHVREFNKSLDCCAGRFKDFVSDMIPVFDRLKVQELNNIEIADTSTQIYPIINVELDLEEIKATIIEDDSEVIKAYVMQDDLTKEVEETKETKAPSNKGRKPKGK